MLEGANILPNEEKLIRATIIDITYDHVLKKLKDIYGDDKPSELSFNLKSESTFYTQMETPPSDAERTDQCDHMDEDDVNDTLYTHRQR